jgi:hypothetical protein
MIMASKYGDLHTSSMLFVIADHLDHHISTPDSQAMLSA